MNNLSFELDTTATAKNRLYAPGDLAQTDETKRGMQYDAAGNLKRDTYTGAGDRSYDAENRMTKAWGGNGQWQEYSYNGDGQRTRRKVDGVETWQVYGLGGELLAEYAANAGYATPQKEYGYRNGQLLVTVGIAGEVPVTWNKDSQVKVTASGNSLTKTASGSSAWNAGASSQQSIANGDGYMEFTASETNKARAAGLNKGDTNQNWTDIDYCIQLDASGNVSISEGATSRGTFGTYASGDRFRVGVEGGVVKYRKNGTLLYTSTVTPGYPLLVDTSLYTNGATINNVVTYGTDLRWLVTDQLGTPRIVVDQSGSLLTTKRHDYLPFGEELFEGTGGRTTTMGYSAVDNVQQKFTLKERDNETGLDYFGARYFSSKQGRFTSPDEFSGGPHEAFGEMLPPNPLLYAEPTEPQSFNKYSYCLGNPLRYVDPDGHQTAAADALTDVANQTQAMPVISGVLRVLAAAAAALVVAHEAGPAILEANGTPGAMHPGCPAIMDCGPAPSFLMKNGGQQQGSDNQGGQRQGQSNTASPNPGNNNDKKPIFGEKGTQTTSTTVGNGKGWRVDVENPNPGQRPGQIHYQSGIQSCCMIQRLTPSSALLRPRTDN